MMLAKTFTAGFIADRIGGTATTQLVVLLAVLAVTLPPASVVYKAAVAGHDGGGQDGLHRGLRQPYRRRGHDPDDGLVGHGNRHAAHQHRRL